LPYTAGGTDVIKALSEASIGLQVGSTFVMIVPPEYGFGSKGVPGFIPPESTLIFEIVIVGVNELKIK
jgi:FKBP-type peptidyl-prolyl cis-trans isomerase